MKLLTIVWTLCSLAFAIKADTSGVLFNVDDEDLEHSFNKLIECKDSLSKNGDGHISAIINEFVDRILANIEVLAKTKGLDPMPITGFDDNFLLARVRLSNGSLEGVSSILRNGDAVVSYQMSTNILDLKVPIKFDHIRFGYKFYVFFLLLGHSGKLTGNIDRVKATAELSFDFNVYQAKLNAFFMRDTGHISIHVEGGIIEVVLSILSELFTTVIHPLIIGVIQGVVKSALKMVVYVVNTAINDVLHPNATVLLF